MNIDVSSLPDNVIELKGVISFLVIEQEEKERSYQRKIEYLEEQVRLLRNEIFGRKTEKQFIPEPPSLQMGLFNDPEAVLPEVEPEDEIAIPAHRRRFL